MEREEALVDTYAIEQDGQAEKPDPVNVLITRLVGIMAEQHEENSFTEKSTGEMPRLERNGYLYECLRHRLRIYKDDEDHFLEFSFQLKGPKWERLDFNLIRRKDNQYLLSIRYPDDITQEDRMRLTDLLEKALYGLGSFQRPQVQAEKEEKRRMKLAEKQAREELHALLDRF